MTTQEYAYLRLRNAVMVGALPPGTGLTFRGLAEQLSLSPTPIREALRRLSSENAIKVLGNRRLRVPTDDPGPVRGTGAAAHHAGNPCRKTGLSLYLGHRHRPVDRAGRTAWTRRLPGAIWMP
jgi:hypothetical protein